jgi:hypothetical protein
LQPFSAALPSTDQRSTRRRNHSDVQEHEACYQAHLGIRSVCVLGAVVSAIGIRNMISVNASTAGCTSKVNGSVAQLDQITRQNAALVEQSAAVAESLKERPPARAGGRHIPTRDHCVRVALNLTLNAPISR